LEALHARYQSFPNDPAYVPSAAGGDTLTEVNASHLQINFAPNFSGNIGLSYAYRLTRGLLNFNISGSYIDAYPVNPDGRVKSPTVDLVSSGLVWTLPDGHWKLHLWGANLLNRHYYSYASASATGDVYSAAAPRTVEFSVGGQW
jgi:outer membrane receptor protein involved in Fe transport